MRLFAGHRLAAVLWLGAAMACAPVAPGLAAPSDAQWIDPWAPREEALPAPSSSVPTLSAPGLARLEAAIVRYRKIASGGWKRIPDGEPLEKNVRDRRVAALRARLVATGDMASTGGDPELFDEAVAAGLRRFQSRHGIAPDGIAGRATVAALNVPAAVRLRQLEVNRRRLAGAVPALGTRYVFVNIAGQEVEAVEDGKVAIRKRVIVGKEDRQTPEYSSAISSVTLNPYWNVPHSIATKDILPRIRSNPGYLARMGIRVLRNDGSEVDASAVDWADPGAARTYRLRQDPSRLNSLGTVRINFANPFAVYLHDTPVKSLFSRGDRSFSSGCVRVEDIRDLTAWLLADAGWERARIGRAIAVGEHEDVRLAAPVPIHMLYLSAWADEDGAVHFRDDVYARDRKLSSAK